MKNLLPIIEEQINVLTYTKSNFTLILKKSALESFKKVYIAEPEITKKYLTENSRSGGLQNKLFKHYIQYIEDQLPFTILKNKENIIVDNLLNKHLNIFDGVSVFTGTVNDNLKVKNGTKENYIGGRSCSIIRPFYIGKILKITDEFNNDYTSKICNYTFNYVKFSEVEVGQQLTITHLRTYPHYQMGAMTYINRARLELKTAMLV